MKECELADELNLISISGKQARLWSYTLFSQGPIRLIEWCKIALQPEYILALFKLSHSVRAGTALRKSVLSLKLISDLSCKLHSCYLAVYRSGEEL